MSLLTLLIACLCASPTESAIPNPSANGGQDQQPARKIPQAKSLLGKPLYAPPPSEKVQAQLAIRKRDYESATDEPDRLIWYGRFLAYAGDYRKAIAVFSRGIEQFPEDARMYRHRGHRYITVREFDKAIRDLRRAAELIRGKTNQVEPDGMPNAKGIPISTLHGNIYYHLGLAHYLKNNVADAVAAYRKCLQLRTNDDNTVSASHWIYMILRRMGRDAEATASLRDIQSDMNIIENFSYHRACLFYKGELSLDEVSGVEGESPANDALRYAIANWQHYNGQTKKARAAFQAIVARGTWASFGHIAAEADLARIRATRP